MRNNRVRPEAHEEDQLNNGVSMFHTQEQRPDTTGKSPGLHAAAHAVMQHASHAHHAGWDAASQEEAHCNSPEGIMLASGRLGLQYAHPDFSSMLRPLTPGMHPDWRYVCGRKDVLDVSF